MVLRRQDGRGFFHPASTSQEVFSLHGQVDKSWKAGCAWLPSCHVCHHGCHGLQVPQQPPYPPPWVQQQKVPKACKG